MEYLTEMMEALWLEQERRLSRHSWRDCGDIIKHWDSMKELVRKAIATKVEEAQSSKASVGESTRRLLFAERADDSLARLAKSPD
jgi:hypothetical protein